MSLNLREVLKVSRPLSWFNTVFGCAAGAFVAGESLTGRSDQAGTVSFGTEAGIYAKAGIPTLVCGPGNIDRAHKADEWIGLDELAACSAMMGRIAERLDRPYGEWLARG